MMMFRFTDPHVAVTLLALLCPYLLGRIDAANCADRTVVVVGHPDDALAFMHSEVLFHLQRGACIDLISMTSFYDFGGPISGREEGARAMYEVFTRGTQDPNPTTFANAQQVSVAGRDTWRYNIYNDNQVKMINFRLPSSTYAGFSAGSLYGFRNDGGLVNALAQLFQEANPARIYTMTPDSNRLVEAGPCPVQNAGVFSTDECDHYDHVGASILAEAAWKQTGLNIPMFQFKTYDMAAGVSVNFNISPEACQKFCLARDAYLQYDPLAAATPWGAFLSSRPQYVEKSQSDSTGPEPAPAPVTRGGGSTTGIMVLVSGLSSSLCMGSLSGNDNVGSTVGTVTCGSSGSSLSFANGQLQVGSPPGNCIAPTSASLLSEITIVSCDSADVNQKWGLEVANGALRHINSNLVVDVPYGSTTPGQILSLYSLHGGNNQKWSFEGGNENPAPAPAPVPPTTLGQRIATTLGGGLCIGASGGKAVLGDCGGDSSVFRTVPGTRQLRNAAGLCLDNTAGAFGLLVATACRVGATSQSWTLNNGAEIRSDQNANAVIDIPYSRNVAGQELFVYGSYHGGANQNWVLV